MVIGRTVQHLYSSRTTIFPITCSVFLFLPYETKCKVEVWQTTRSKNRNMHCLVLIQEARELLMSFWNFYISLGWSRTLCAFCMLQVIQIITISLYHKIGKSMTFWDNCTSTYIKPQTDNRETPHKNSLPANTWILKSQPEYEKLVSASKGT